MMRDTAIVAVLLAFLAGLDTTAQAQARRGGAPKPLDQVRLLAATPPSSATC